MIRRSLALLLFLLAASAGLQAAEPVVRVEILTQPPIVSGQQVEIQVDVLVPNFFLSSPKFPVFDLPDAIVTLPDTGALNLVETIDGQSYAGIRRIYLVTPQAPGDFSLPQAKISFTYAAVPGQTSEGAVTLPPRTFTVAGAPAGGGTAATRITVTQDIDRDPKSLKEGDTLVRIVTITAEGMQAMMIPVPQFDTPPGVRLYPHDPLLSDNLDQRKGPLGGKRVDKVTYAFEKAGSYALPAIAIGWYDPKTQKHEVAEAPEITVTVVAAPGFTPAIKPPDTSDETAPRHPVPWTTLAWGAGALFGLALLVWLVPSLWAALSLWWRARRHRYEQSEAYSFRQFSTACRRGEGARVYAALQSWAGRAKAAPLRDWLRRGGDSAALIEYEQLEARLFAGVPDTRSFDAGKLLAAITLARRKWLERDSETTGPALPPLNP